MGKAEELPHVDLSVFPARDPAESLESYLRRCLHCREVSIGALARHLDMQRVALYQIRDGGGAAPKTLIRFGALMGELENDAPTREFLRALGFLEFAEAGWKSRAALLAWRSH